MHLSVVFLADASRGVVFTGGGLEAQGWGGGAAEESYFGWGWGKSIYYAIMSPFPLALVFLLLDESVFNKNKKFHVTTDSPVSSSSFGGYLIG